MEREELATSGTSGRRPLICTERDGCGRGKKRREKRRILPVLLALLAVMPAVPQHAISADSSVSLRQARDVIRRTIDGHSASFRLALIPQEEGKDVFEVEASQGVVTVRGSDALAVCRGFYHYLRNACNGQVTWSGSHVSLPDRLPDYRATRVICPYRYRQIFNVCTFGYTTVWWDWKRWEREIDWMALHGINMPLAMVGEEAVWQRVWTRLGISPAELSAYFTGPAFLPWHRMGNVNTHGGPLPQAWLNGQAALQKRILGRMRALGMMPVVPAFAGFVPESFRRLHPEARVYDLDAWGSFPPDYRTHILSPTSPLFREIGKRFIREYHAMFGPAHYYLADSFNELKVPVSDTARYRELAEFGKGVYSSIRAGDPEGVWVMQGWLFFNDRKFWDKASAHALLSDVPDDSTVILDLANELFHGWKEQDAFYGKGWIYSTIHNFGGNNPLNGGLSFIATDPIDALSNPAHGRLEGIGLAPEGIENNDALYELATDMYWSERPLALHGWLESYARSRYGACPGEMSRAWDLLSASAYAGGRGWNIRHGFQLRPREQVQGEADVSPAFAEAVRSFLSCADSLRGSALYRADAIELAVQYLGGEADNRLRSALRAHASGTGGLRDTLEGEAIALMNDIDALLNCREDRRLERWITDARRWGTTQTESDLYERNARLQVTLWGGPELFDYAAKVWSGLVRDFYVGRWKKYFELLRATPAGEHVRTEDLVTWEQSWTEGTSLTPARTLADPITAAREMVERASHELPR